MIEPTKLTIHGRGAADNPANRFEPIAFEVDGDFLDDEEQPAPQTRYFRDASRSIILHNDSPDIGFTWSINVYRGCSHGWMCSRIIPQSACELLTRQDTAYTLDMPSAIALAEIDRQIDAVVMQLEAASAQGHLNIHSARRAGGIAGLLERPDLVRRLEAVIAGLTVKDLLKGAITNFELSTIDAARPVELASPEDTARDYPRCDDQALIEQMRTYGGLHVRLCLEGDVNRATQVATTSLELEDIGCTLAAMGQFDRATSFIDAATLGERVGARKHVRCVILLEKCRRGHPDFPAALQQASLHGGDAEQCVILALAGRLPWRGYPFCDY